MTTLQPILGAHFSISGGLEKAVYEAARYGCTALQIFTKNTSAWKERTLTRREIARFKSARLEIGLQEIASHTSYLINLAGIDEEKRKMSFAALKQEMIRADALDIPYVVLHPGSHMGSGETAGIDKIASAINRLFAQAHFQKSRLLLETTAGQGSSVGHRFGHLADIIEKAENHNRIGVCVDTCHIFAAGYDIRSVAAYQKTWRQFDEIVGMQRLFLIHLNDSKRDLGSRVDRHAHIGKGKIGLNAFKLIMNDRRLADIPKIIETPKGKKKENFDKMNLACLRRFVSGV